MILRAEKNVEGIWEIFLERNLKDGSYPVNLNSIIQVLIVDEFDNELIRYPLWARASIIQD